jgi:hypothetical protein
VADESVLQYREWQVPPAAAVEDRRLKWLNEATEEGQAWIKSQRGHSDWRRALDTIAGQTDQQVPEYRSKLKTNHLKRNVREIVGTLAKLRPLWGYGSDNKAFLQQAQMMNKVARALYLEQFFDLSIKEALQYAATTCTGWIRPIYRREMGGRGKGGIKLLTYGAPCVLPVQLPTSGDFQQAYAVTLLDEMPIWMAHSMFPTYQDKLRPTAALYWYSPEIRQSASGNLWKRIFSFGKSNTTVSSLSDLMVPIRYTTVNDLAVNRTDQMIPMGEPGTSWYYEVPHVGQRIPTRINMDGSAEYREATAEDALLYPNRRMIISSEACIMYDGPAFNWHGRLDLIPITLDRWAWEPMGFSLMRDGYDIQYAIDELWRGVVDKLRAKNDPGMGYDINSVTKREAAQFDPMQPRARIGFDGAQVDKPFTSPIDPSFYQVGEEEFTGIAKLEETMDKQQAIRDVMALAKARLAGDDIEKVMEANGPIIEDMSRSMEPSIRELGEQIKYLVLQYMDTSRIMQYIGPDNVAMQTFDYDPNSLVPSHLPGEDPQKPSPTKQIKRAKTTADNLRFLITPNSLHEHAQMWYRLGLVQLKKAGAKISSQTLAEAWNVPNYGTFDGSTEIEKWRSEQEEDLEFAARMKQLGVSLPGLAPPGAAAPGKQPEGRPATGQQAPALKQKSDGRGTITESSGGGRVV